MTLHAGKGARRAFVGRARSTPQPKLATGFRHHLIGHET